MDFDAKSSRIILDKTLERIIKNENRDCYAFIIRLYDDLFREISAIFRKLSLSIDDYLSENDEKLIRDLKTVRSESIKKHNSDDSIEQDFLSNNLNSLKALRERLILKVYDVDRKDY